MVGGDLVITPIENIGFSPEDATIMRNTYLYGATGGQVFVKGKTGEHFVVRNSLVEAVVKGTGYMIGGCAVVLGKVDRNVAASMTGGLAYILDKDDTLIPKINKKIKIKQLNRVVSNIPSFHLHYVRKRNHGMNNYKSLSKERGLI
ncbi:hypothetical protein IEQ34_019575 [Dendrobium chrysotoxum]|uniref:Glutamate synthase alpha subunit C-terminal domain-containing protein n=1 Tax=Dendrobium chrysotoxum TaxID=161865 RepID=A0AAV7G7D8_DENCH|nr:hypothetical protein IEQ34_019575 [Dendrobium chrysotoxum]